MFMGAGSIGIFGVGSNGGKTDGLEVELGLVKLFGGA